VKVILVCLRMEG